MPSDSRSDEQLPLLFNDEIKTPTPLPKVQISVLMLAMVVEPIAAQCIYPFINRLVSELDITGGDDRNVGYYAGLIESLFFVTQACTVFQWSRVSDHVGRKPVLLLGVLGLALSMLCFGLSRTFTGLVLSRCITGALNGNIGVMKSMLGELTDSTNMAQGFALVPMAWSFGATLGPVIGGTLARPQDHFPSLFSSTFWAEYPYFLPCGVASAFSVVTFLAILFLLEETLHPAKDATFADREAASPEIGYGAILAQQGSSPAVSDTPIPLRTLLNRSRVLRIVNYGVIATLEIALFALQPLFYSTPVEFGGLGFSPLTIGLWMATLGITNGLIQAFFFAWIVDRTGPRKLFRIGHACFIPIYCLFPVIRCAAQRYGTNWLVWALLTCQLILTVVMDMSYSCILMYITAAAPNKRSLGALNGLAQTTASIVRAIGPASATSMFAYSIQHKLLGGHAVYVAMALLALSTTTLAAQLPEDIRNCE